MALLVGLLALLLMAPPVPAAARAPASVLTALVAALARAPATWSAVQPWLRARPAGKVTALALTPPARLIYAAR